MARWKALCELSRVGREREGERAVRRQKLVEEPRCSLPLWILMKSGWDVQAR